MRLDRTLREHDTPMVTLRDLYVVELSDLLDAESQLLRELPLMAARATSEQLRALFDRFPDLGAAGVPTRRPTRVLRGYASLPVALNRASVPA